jgi:hypothetical protein
MSIDMLSTPIPFKHTDRSETYRQAQECYYAMPKEFIEPHPSELFEVAQVLGTNGRALSQYLSGCAQIEGAVALEPCLEADVSDALQLIDEGEKRIYNALDMLEATEQFYRMRLQICNVDLCRAIVRADITDEVLDNVYDDIHQVMRTIHASDIYPDSKGGILHEGYLMKLLLHDADNSKVPLFAQPRGDHGQHDKRRAHDAVILDLDPETTIIMAQKFVQAKDTKELAGAERYNYDIPVISLEALVGTKRLPQLLAALDQPRQATHPTISEALRNLHARL